MLYFDLGDGGALRLLEARHASELFALVETNRVRLKQWLGWLDDVTKVEHSALFIRRMLRKLSKNQGYAYGIFQDNALAGVIDLHGLSWENRHASIGYWLGEGYTGRGLMTRAVRAMCDEAFHELGMNRVEIRASVGNARSRAVPRRLGFQEEGVVRQVLWLYDHFVDEVVHSMLAEGWTKR
jgi:ribosomal-protein-serine acetyltransferase